MKITIVYDNISTSDALISDWGFSCVVELPDRKILFDTGGNGRILLENMFELNIDPNLIDDIIISHSDFDHIGGLSHFLNLNSSAVIHNPISFRGIKYPNQVTVKTQVYGPIRDLMLMEPLFLKLMPMLRLEMLIFMTILISSKQVLPLIIVSAFREEMINLPFLCRLPIWTIKGLFPTTM
jgi:hypothetical protein